MRLCRLLLETLGVPVVRSRLRPHWKIAAPVILAASESHAPTCSPEQSIPAAMTLLQEIPAFHAAGCHGVVGKFPQFMCCAPRTHGGSRKIAPGGTSVGCSAEARPHPWELQPNPSQSLFPRSFEYCLFQPSFCLLSTSSISRFIGLTFRMETTPHSSTRVGGTRRNGLRRDIQSTLLFTRNGMWLERIFCVLKSISSSA
jgi:hypothetical protein